MIYKKGKEKGKVADIEGVLPKSDSAYNIIRSIGASARALSS